VEKEDVLAVKTFSIQNSNTKKRRTLTLTIAAPNASVEEPAKAATTRLAKRLSKLCDRADQTTQQNNNSDATTKTGLLPMYSAVGTQKKFCRS
jgi:hypothetical protein